MHVVQTPGLPPNHGRIYLPISGWTWKRRNAPVKIVRAKANIEERDVVAMLRGAEAQRCGAKKLDAARSPPASNRGARLNYVAPLIGKHSAPRRDRFGQGTRSSGPGPAWLP